MNYPNDLDQGASKFNELSLKHDLQDKALKKAEFLLQFCPNISFVTIAGPTGVGKTHLLRRLEMSLNQIYHAQNSDDPSAISCISTIAVAAGAKQFDWRRFYIDALEALHDPFAMILPATGIVQSRFKAINESSTVGELRFHLEQELRMRNTKAWIIDEAQHQLTGGAKGEPGDQFDVLKSISQTTNTKLILAGTYALPSYLAYSGQVMRRSSTVHLPRYDYKKEVDRKMFSSVAKTLFNNIEMQSQPSVMPNFDLLYTGSLGCIGVLKDWLARARAMAVFERSTDLTVEHLHETMLSPQTLQEMIDEIIEGEAIQGLELSEVLKAKILGSKNPPACQQTHRVRHKNKHRPGVRRPSHDVVPNHPSIDQKQA